MERLDVSFELDFGEERRRVGGRAFTQRLWQSLFDVVPVLFGEVGLELEQGWDVLHTAGGTEGGFDLVRAKQKCPGAPPPSLLCRCLLGDRLVSLRIPIRHVGSLFLHSEKSMQNMFCRQLCWHVQGQEKCRRGLWWNNSHIIVSWWHAAGLIGFHDPSESENSCWPRFNRSAQPTDFYFF